MLGKELDEMLVRDTMYEHLIRLGNSHVAADVELRMAGGRIYVG